MTEQETRPVMDVQQVVAAYGAAWNEPDEPTRRRLLEQSWADDGCYEDPTGRAEGRDALVGHIGGFHQQMAGSRIELTSGVDLRGRVLRFAWRMLDPQGGVVLDGIDFGELAPDGRLARIEGFFGPLPEPPVDAPPAG
jgi:hypothetical protein